MEFICRGNLKIMSRLGLKVLRLVSIVVGIVVLISVISYGIIFKNVEIKLKDSAKSSIAESINAVDKDKIEKVLKDNSNKSKEYKEVLNSMIVFKAKKDIKNFYIFIKKDDKNVQFLFDASPEPAEYMENYEIQKEMSDAFEGNIAVSDKPYSDKWGTYVSGYAPIKSSSGQVIAIIGADEDISTFQNIKQLFFRIAVLEIIVATIISLLSVWLFSKKLKYNIGIIQNKLENMSKGNLQGNIELKTKDEIEEIAHFLNGFRLKVNDMLINIKNDVSTAQESSDGLYNTAKDIASASEHVSSITQGVSENSLKQAADIFNIKENFNEFGMVIDNTVKIVNEFDTMANNIKEKSKESSKDVNLLINSINDLNIHFKAVIEKIQGLGSSIGKINDITNLINNISDQTNLLALNASIEAARAGELGKGFSVVAEEIRVLAEQSKISSKNISELLKNLSEQSDMVAINTKNVDSQFSNQITIVNGIASSFGGIIGDMENLLPGINLINKSMIEVNSKKSIILTSLAASSSASEEISASSEEISSLSEELNGSTEEVSNAAEKLLGMVNDVMNNVNNFKTEVKSLDQ